jgi:hypothetical protein
MGWENDDGDSNNNNNKYGYIVAIEHKMYLCVIKTDTRGTKESKEMLCPRRGNM